MKTLNKLKNKLFYAGACPEKYRQIVPDIHTYNRKRLFAFSLVTIFFLTVMVALSFIVDVARVNLWVYLLALALTLIILIFAEKFTKEHPKLLSLAIYSFISVLFLLGIFIGTITHKDTPTTTFIAFLLTIPLLFALRPIDNIRSIIIFDTLFIIMVILFKDEQVIAKDIIHGLIYGSISIIVSSYAMNVVMENFIMKNSLIVMAETDQLTCLRNRNCYERQLQRYADLYGTPISSMTCIYVDINGLHEINNTHGHAAGDAMLKFIAKEFKNQFGEDNCYRIGGDEYVAFVQDMDEDTLATKVQTLIKKVEAHNYYIAIGHQTQTKDHINIDTLVKAAEKKMFDSKHNFYSQKSIIEKKVKSDYRQKQRNI